MPTKFLVGQMLQSALLKGAQIFANSEHLNAKIYRMYESLVTMSGKLPNDPLHPTGKKLRSCCWLSFRVGHHDLVSHLILFNSLLRAIRPAVKAA